jgi:hypothetical protein
MTQYIVIIPKIGEPYITNYENRLHIDNSSMDYLTANIFQIIN